MKKFFSITGAALIGLLIVQETFAATQYQVGEAPVAITSGDLNGDGFMELLTANLADGTISILFNSGDGTFIEPFTPIAIGPTRDVAVAEMTGDEFMDIISPTANLGGAILVFPGLGNGQFFSAIETPLSEQDITSIEVRDLNGDGKNDVQAHYQSLGILKTLIGNGNGTFQTPTDAPGSLPVPPTDINVDLNNDGIADTARALSSQNAVSVTISADTPQFPHPKKKADCKNNGYKNYFDNDNKPFKNQGQCIKYVHQETAKKFHQFLQRFLTKLTHKSDR